ncbi:heavy metal-associated isoprenylated plant protein 41 [Elaeis guineensis]|uniref:Heavy metal-associated isoprenylated plant protein 41 n=1 Tax=Elaeis guineensis var. tenera TaxID=51953 RepID=A0A6I9SN97_ELAGV|nr:heavy metal-associated isoprenylated plant protein 41 [Elaeis guineensis]
MRTRKRRVRRELSPEDAEEAKEEANEEETEKVIWVKHYSSLHEILLVGEGDFSFSFSLANAFGSASNIVATSLDSHDVVVVKYAKAKTHLESLEKMGATILHGVDATKMKLHTDLKMHKFDRIVFNFPHAGFKGREEQMKLINLHRKLVQGFFKNASHMLRPYGEVHVSHKTGGPFRKWNLEELASKNSLILVECSNFKIEDYPGYNNKRGDGPRCDQTFPLGKCCTFKFRIGEIQKLKQACKKKMDATSNMDFSYGRCGTNTTEIDDDRLRSISRVNHPVAIQNPGAVYLDSVWGRAKPAFGINSVYLRVYRNYLEDVRMVSRYGPDLSYANFGNSNNVYVNEMNGTLARTNSVYMRGHRELCDMSSFRQVNSPRTFGPQETEATPIRVTSRAHWY